MVSWVREIPEDQIIVHGEFVFLSADTLKSLDTYDTSTPTSPSPGRIYKKNLNWGKRGADPNYWVYIVKDDPDEPGWQIHVPHRAIVLGG